MPRAFASAAIAARSASRSSGLVGVSTQISFVFGSDRALDGAEIAQIDERELEPGGAPPHALEQAKRAAIDIVARHHMIAGRQQFQHRGDRREARRESKTLRAAFQIGDAALERLAGRVLAAGIFVALVNAGLVCA